MGWSSPIYLETLQGWGVSYVPTWSHYARGAILPNAALIPHLALLAVPGGVWVGRALGLHEASGL